MRFIPVTPAEREHMLAAVGVTSVAELFEVVPEGVRLTRPLALARGLSEPELARKLKELAGAGLGAERLVCFAGAGCYDHHIPAIVDHVVRKPEFFTAYTPYQPEVSQGTLQAMWEFQTMVCELTGMGVANASMYDGGTALVEGAHLAARVTKRDRVVAAATVHPEWLEVLATYDEAGRLSAKVAPSAGGRVDLEALRELAEGAAGVLVQHPDFYGNLEDLAAVRRICDETGALMVVAFDPVLAGVLEPPGSFGADVVVGEGQAFGSPMSFGGPGLGFLACRDAHLRSMPGRIAGKTVDADGRPAYVLTMQTREQHIRREKATSNICSNHALNALAFGVHLAALGAEGLAELGGQCVAKARYLRGALLATGRFSAPWDVPFGREFALRYDGDVEAMQAKLLQRGFLAGVALGRFLTVRADLGPDAASLVLFAVTEKRTRDEMDALAREVASL